MSDTEFDSDIEKAVETALAMLVPKKSTENIEKIW